MNKIITVVFFLALSVAAIADGGPIPTCPIPKDGSWPTLCRPDQHPRVVKN